MRIRRHEDIEVHVNIRALATCRGKYVPGTLREEHNVFTETGRDWLANLVAWQTVGSPDVPITQRRVRWAAVGTGGDESDELVSVDRLVSPAKATLDAYLSSIDSSERPSDVLRAMRFFKEFTEFEISYDNDVTGPSVAVTEAGLFVDVFPADTAGAEDAATGLLNTTLNPAEEFNPPVAYVTFEPINKTQDFKLVLQWDFRFG